MNGSNSDDFSAEDKWEYDLALPDREINELCGHSGERMIWNIDFIPSSNTFVCESVCVQPGCGMILKSALLVEDEGPDNET